MPYMPIWFLYMFYFISYIGHIIKFGIVYVTLYVSSKVVKIDDVRGIISCIKIWSFCILAEVLGIILFYVTEMHLPFGDVYYEHYTAFCLIMLFVAMLISFFTIYFLALKEFALTKKQKIWISVMTTLFSAPYLFLIPN